jgi:cytosine/adenosine deaminase-related metal-dependent hydrolase
MSKDALLIRDALVVSNDPDRSLPFTGWVRVEGDRIVEVGEGQQTGAADAKVIDGAGHALLPGLVNAHAHSHSGLTRGSAEGLRLGAPRSSTSRRGSTRTRPTGPAWRPMGKRCSQGPRPSSICA